MFGLYPFGLSAFGLPYAASGAGASAPGASLTASASLSGGSASADASAPGASIAASASMSAGAATAGASSSVSIASPTANKLFQRNGSNQASVTIGGTYSGTPASLEYQFDGGAWQTLVASPSGGAFSQSVTLSVGQGDIRVRFSNDYAAVGTVSNVGVGDIFLTAGQSNNVGAATSEVQPVASAFTAVEYVGGTWIPLRESATDYTQSYSGLSGYKGSYFGRLSNLLQSQGVPVGFVPCAQGSTTIANWQKGQSLYTTMISQLSSVGGSCKAVIFWLGESDANNGTTQSAFETGLNQFINDVYADTGAGVFINKIVRWIPAADTIRAAQSSVIASNPHVIGSADCDVYAASGVHYLTTTDINNVAAAVYSGMLTAFYPDAFAPGATISVSSALSAGGASVDVLAPGASLSASSSFIPGGASALGAGGAPGGAIFSYVSLLPGVAAVDVFASGAALSVATSIYGGFASIPGSVVLYPKRTRKENLSTEQRASRAG